MKREAAFRALASNRAAQRADNNAAKLFHVYKLKKDGNPYKNPVELSGAFNDENQALHRARQLMALNPGSGYVVLP